MKGSELAPPETPLDCKRRLALIAVFHCFKKSKNLLGARFAGIPGLSHRANDLSSNADRHGAALLQPAHDE